MDRLIIAIEAFFLILRNLAFAGRVEQLMQGLTPQERAAGVRPVAGALGAVGMVAAGFERRALPGGGGALARGGSVEAGGGLAERAAAAPSLAGTGSAGAIGSGKAGAAKGSFSPAAFSPAAVVANAQALARQAGGAVAKAMPVGFAFGAKSAARSDALTLLAVLQREARLIDFLQEPIAPYTDAQVGAAVREVHAKASAVLERTLALQQVMGLPEGTVVQVPADASRVKLAGNVTGQPPYRGRLTHPGWEATKLELPAWTGANDAARIIAPAEVELG
jgi:hypothetical protein